MTEKMEEKLQFSAEISKILQLMIHSLYTNKAIFLRELISNASDACDKLRYESLTHPALLSEGGELGISIVINKDARTVTVSDTGIGMSREELIANLGTIAKSGTQEFVAQLTGDNKKDMPLIGQFGVGFYSSFMVADKVVVVSTRAGSSESWQWESEGAGEFTVTPADKALRGTSITLHMKEGADEYLDQFRLRHIITTYSDHISFPISIGDAEQSEVVNTVSALWMRPKAEITPEQYKEFYHHVAHLPDEPFLTLHNRAEGKLEYTSLLFVPSLKPFDLYHPDRKASVKLYVKRVFITEENVEMIPRYLRFLRGVIDSEDLPLNISRETLQHNPLLTKIRDSVVKRMLGELKKKAESDEVGYAAFWKNFGPVLKEGLCEATSPREAMLEACRFNSTATSPSPVGGGKGGGAIGENLSSNAPLPASPLLGEELTSLDAYVERMKEGQDTIYTLSGDRLDILRLSPQLEGFAKKGIEVLLLTDHVDDFWTNVIYDFKGKKFKSVTRADIELDNIGEKTPEEKPETKADDKKIAALCERIKELLGAQVKDVRPTGKLTNSAVCLAVEEGAMDFRLERFLIEQKQLQSSTAKILEVNPQHPIIRSLMNETPAFDDTVWLLLDQARIMEGEQIADPAGFTRRLQSFVEKSLAA